MTLPVAVPSSVYVLRRKSEIVGYMDKGKPYIIGFMQQTHAHLVKRHITATPMVRLDRNNEWAALRGLEGDEEHTELKIDMDARLSILKLDDNEKAIPLDWEVAVVEYEKFMRIPLKSRTGILIPYAFMEEDESDESYNFRCQVLDSLLP